MIPDEYGLPPAVVRMRARRRHQLDLARAAGERAFREAAAADMARSRAEHQAWVRRTIPSYGVIVAGEE